MLTEAPLLQVPDFRKPITVVTDASLVGLGGVLLQDDKPCAFESKKFTDAECRYTTTEREMLGTVHCYQKWRVYLKENPENVIETDHIPNIYFQTKPHLSAREVRWMETLSSFPGQWKYKPGKTNIADPLSRMPSFYMLALLKARAPAKELTTSKPLQVTQTDLLKRIRLSYSEDPDFTAEKYELQDGLHFFKGNIVIPNNTDLKNHIIHECHDSLFAGHMGRDKTLAAVKNIFHWRKMHEDI